MISRRLPCSCTTLLTRFSDAQCGFKAVRADCACELLPLVEDTGWFFDTELLVLAERAGLRIHEVPVDSVDDPDSRVDVLATAIEDLRGSPACSRSWRRAGLAGAAAQPARAPAARRAGREAVEPAEAGPLRRRRRGEHACIPAAVRAAARAMVGAQGANLLALLATAVANTAANRRLTFGIRARLAAARSQFEGLVVFGAGLCLTSSALAVMHRR